jgi:hypothetical protein
MMSRCDHHDVRTTLTLDEDVATKLQTEARHSGRPFREVVNDTLRRGLLARREAMGSPPFRVTARDLGELRQGLSLDSVADMLEQIEGALHR